MKFSKKHLILIAVVSFILFGAFARIFPDPWHETDNVTFFEWIYREVHELIYGEKENGS